MQAKLILTGAGSFILGGIVSFLLFATKAHDSSEPDRQRSTLTSERRILPYRTSPSVEPSLQSAEKTSGQSPEDHIDRESLRRFLSIDPDDLGDPEELVEWGLSEEDALEVSAAYADTIESARRMEAKLVTVEIDEDGNEYLHIPAHAEESKSIISALEKRLQGACPSGSAGVLAEIVSADVFGIDQYRSDELPRMIYLTHDQDGRVSYHDQLMSEGGEELVSQVYVGEPGDEDIPPPLVHLFEGAKWSNKQLHDNP